jgi:glycerate-2-kinase
LVAAALAGRTPGSEIIADRFTRARRIFLIAAGKAASAMGHAVAVSAADRLEAGLIVLPAGTSMSADWDGVGGRIEVVSGGHPIPDANSVAAAARAFEIARRVSPLKDPDDLLVVALSGGASAMLAMPAAGITLDDKIAMTTALMRAGASIQELNTVRKHISTIKGGGLLKAAGGAETITLALSDVIGNDAATIGSGPTVADPTTFSDAIGVLKRRGAWGRAPEAIRDRLERGLSGELEETLKPGALELVKSHYFVIADNDTAVEAASAVAAGLGYKVVRRDRITGDANEAGRSFARAMASTPPGHRCVISGGETVVTVRGAGRGGRAQQAALALAIELAGMNTKRPMAALVAGTDGIDGPTDAAGAFADITTVERARAVGLDPALALSRNDSYSFFAGLGDLLITGPTGTNVADLMFGLTQDDGEQV